jgi:hypothetical protein
MKTTLDLPDDLVHALKLRALQEGRKLKELVATLLASGLATPQTLRSQPVRGVLHFPLIPCGPDAPAKSMTVEQLLAAEQAILTQQDLEHHRPL